MNMLKLDDLGIRFTIGSLTPMKVSFFITFLILVFYVRFVVLQSFLTIVCCMTSYIKSLSISL